MRAPPAPACAGLLLPLVMFGAVQCSSPTREELDVCRNVECTAGKCRLDNGEPVCVCTAEDNALHRTCEVKVIYVVDGNDSRATATPLQVPTPFTPASIDPSRAVAGDFDFYTFQAVHQHVYRFTCRTGTLGTCAVRLQDPSGVELDSQASPPGGEIGVNLKADVDGPHYAIVSASLGGTGTYTYALDEVGLDDHGDTLATATPLTPNRPAAAGTVDAQGDVDAFSFQAVTGHAYDFSCSLPGCHLDLRDATGVQLEGGAAGPGGSVELRFRATADGPLFVLLSGPPGPYQYVLEDYGPDDFGDTPAAASTVTLPATVAGRLDLGTDVDVLAFAGTAGHAYRAVCEGVTASGCTVTLRGSSGATLAGPASEATATAPADGPLYVEVAGGDPGTYTLHLDDLGP